jgi:hypothetical protein
MRTNVSVAALSCLLMVAAVAPSADAEPRRLAYGNLLSTGDAPWLVPAQPVSSAYAPTAPANAATADVPSAQEPPHRRQEFVYVNTEGGYQTVDLHMLRADNFIPTTVESSGGGAFFGIGAGVRLAFLTLGGRYRTGQWSNWDLSTLDGELGAHLSLGRVEPYFTFGAGYAAMHAAENTVGGNAAIDVHGFDGRAGIGVDYYADRVLTLGVNFTGDVLALARPGIDLTTSAQAQIEQIAARCGTVADPVGRQQCAVDALHQAEGTSVGFGGALSVVMGLHF